VTPTTPAPRRNDDRRAAGVSRFCTDPAEIHAWLALARLSGLAAASITDAVSSLGSAAELVRRLRRGDPLLELTAAARRTLHEAADGPDPGVERWLDGAGHHLLVHGSDDYPAALRAIAGAPLVLFVEGDLEALHLPQLAIVGSRRPTAAGRALAEAFAAEFGRSGLVVTSGLALGIDAAAHRGALAGGGRTIAVCGTGLARVYPAEHAALARDIARSGALVSEFPLTFPPRPAHFPQRNRIIAGMSLGVLVVEAALRSGSLITARLAGEQGRAVFAVPGSVHNPMARGCHRLIRDGAQLVESAAEVVADLDFGLVTPHLPGRAQAPEADRVLPSGLDTTREMLLNALGYDPVDLDTLGERTGLAARVLAAKLLVLELEGLVESRGGRFCRVPSGRSS
jgi:DNA processing protein